MRTLFILGYLIIFTFTSIAQQKRALLVTIEKYSEKYKWTTLSGDLDGRIATRMLQKQGFNSITHISNEQATKPAVVKALRNIVDNCAQGDIVYIHFSTHGQQVEDINGDETDGFDEAIVLYDSPQKYGDIIGYKGQQHLIDDELNEYLTAISKKIGSSGEILLVMDTCHSGTMNKEGSNATTSRGFADPLYFSAPSQRKTQKRAADPNIVDTKSLNNLTFFAASSEAQINNQARIKGKEVGSLTVFLSAAFSEISTTSTYKDFFDKINKYTIHYNLTQTPHFEGNMAAKIFKGKAIQSKNLTKDEMTEEILNEVVNSVSDVGQTFAVIIGVSDYKFQTPLKYAHLDAIRFNEFLGYQDIPKQNRFLFADTAKLSVQEIYNVIDSLSDRMGKNDKFYFYFSGHGDVDMQGNAVFLLHNAPLGNYIDNSSKGVIKYNELNERFDNIRKKASKILFFADACRSGSASFRNISKAKTITEQLKEWESTVSVLSCQPNELSIETNDLLDGTGLFNYYLLLGLYGDADVMPKDGIVTVKELNSFLHKVPKRNINQNPFATGDQSLVLSKVNDKLLTKIKERTMFIDYSEFTNENNLYVGRFIKAVKANDEETLINYMRFQESLLQRRYIEPIDHCAKFYLNKIQNNPKYLNDRGVRIMEETFFTALFEKIKNGLKVYDDDIVSGDKMTKPMDTISTYNFILPLKEIAEVNRIAIKNKMDKAELNKIEATNLLLQAFAEMPKVLKIPQFMSKEQNDYLKKLINTHKQSLALDSTLSKNYFQVGYLSMRIGSLDDCESYFKKYTDLIPHDSRGNFNLGYFYWHYKRDYKAAIKPLERAIIADSTFGKAYAFLGNSIYKDSKNNSLAKDYLFKAIKFDRALIYSYHYLSDIYIFEKKRDSALIYLNKALSFDNKNSITFYYLGKALETDVDKVKAFKKSVDLYPKQNSALFELFVIWYEKKYFTLALECLKSIDLKGGSFIDTEALPELSNWKPILHNRVSEYRRRQSKELSLFFKYNRNYEDYDYEDALDLAAFYFQSRKNKEALVWVEKAKEIEPSRIENSIFATLEVYFEHLINSSEYLTIKKKYIN